MSILVRARNAGQLTPTAFPQAQATFMLEVVHPTPPRKLAVSNRLVNAALALIGTHSINGTDALVLRSALDLAAQLRGLGDDLFLVASDLRLLRAAQSEGLIT